MGEAKAAMEQAHRAEVDNLARQHAEELRDAQALWVAKDLAAGELLAEVKQTVKAEMKVFFPPLRATAKTRRML
jgi:hypothetical protein